MGSAFVINDVTSVLEVVGATGLVSAVLCAIAAMIATAWNRGGLLAGAVACWLVSLVLTIAYSYGEVWMPIVAALLVMPVLSGIGLALRSAHARADRALRVLSGRPAPLSAAAKAAPWASAEGVLSARR
ncbi:hypothetical protein ACWGJP_02575 [Microbacterium sp. NPDC055903]